MPINLSGNNAPARARSEQSLLIPPSQPSLRASISAAEFGTTTTPKVVINNPSDQDTYECPEQSDACENVERITTVVGVAAGFIPVGGDAIALGASLVNLAVNPSWSNLFDVGLDAVGILPAVPALGTLRRASRLADCLDAAVDVKKVAKMTKAAKTCWENWETEEDDAAPEQVTSNYVAVSNN